MGMPIVKVASGGLPVTIATTGGLPCTEATNGYGIAVTQSPTGGGLAVTGFAFGPTVAITATSVLETAAVNTTVGTLSVSGSFTGTPVYTLSDSAGGKFNISGNLLRTNALLDYETASFHNVTVAVSGTTPATASRVITIFVTDVVEPVIVLTGTSVNENTVPGVNIGTLSIANTFTGSPVYTLVDSSSGKVAISGALLNVGGAIDYETTPTFNITVGVSGITPPAANKVFTIVVNDVVEASYTGPGDIKAGALGWWGLRAYSAAQCTGSVAAIRIMKASDGTAEQDINILANGKLDVATISALGYAVKVKTIYDQSGNNRHLTALTAAYTFVLSSAPDLNLTGVGGTLPCIVFDGVQRLVNVTGLGTVAQPYSISHVFTRTTNRSGYEPYFAPDAATFGLYGNNVANSVLLYTGGGVSAVATAADGTTMHTGQFVFNNASGFLYIDGVNSPGDIGSSASWASGAVAIGNNVSTGMIMRSAEIGFWGAAFTAPEAASMHTNQRNYLDGVGGAVGTTKNIVTDYGAVGDAQWAQTTLSISTNVLTSATPIWPSATSGSEYVGKSIVVGMAGSHSAEAGGGSVLRSTITGWTNSSTITLADNCSWPLSSEPNVIVAWGTNNGKTIADGGVNGPFETFRLAYQGQAVTLTIPAGNYLLSSGFFGPLFDGIRNITVNGAGATLCGGLFILGSLAQYTSSGHSGFTASVSAGATSATLLTPSDVSKFVVGNYAMMTGFGLQGLGFPTNHQLFEYLKITAIDNDGGSPTYGKITFLTPLVNAYLSTWPLYFPESGGNLTAGGPATLYAMAPSFDHTEVINNLTFAHHPQMGVSGLSVTLNNCVFESIWGPHATMAKTIAFNNCLGIKCSMEVDKVVSSLAFTGCDWIALNFQSTCITDCVLDNTDIRQSVTGTPWKITIRNGSTVGTVSGIGVFAPGPLYGYANELIVSNSQIRYFGAVGTHESGGVIPGKDPSNNGVNVDWPSMSGGVITIPSSTYAGGYTPMWPVTGGRVFLVDGVTFDKIGSFRITNVTQSGSNTFVTTTLSGGWPSRSGHKLYLVTHPAPICTFTSVTGCPEVVDLSNAGAAGLPLYSYSKRSYDGSVATMEYWQVWGRVKKIVVIVTQAADGTTFPGAVTLELNINVSDQLIKMSDYSTTTWAPTIDLKRLGTRTFDATAGTYPVSAWSNTATAHADVLPGMTEALWAPGNFRPTMTDTSAAAAGLRPIFSIEVITDQGF